MEGYRLFYDDQEAALLAAIDNNVHGLTFKQVAAKVYPTMKPDSAYARLKAITNRDKDEKADLQELKRICDVCGRFDPLYFLCDELDHARPPRRAPQDRATELVEAFNRNVESAMKLFAQIQANGGVAALRAIDGGKS